jgi:predicted TIM-barrel fold metal-dependent hydrolase
VGYIDCDAHVFETDATWEYFDPAEREFQPLALRDAGGTIEHWLVSGSLRPRGDHVHVQDDDWAGQLYAPGVTSLQDVPARLAHMDRLGVDVQVVFSTFFIRANIHRAMAEAALARSWNRWMADRYHESGGRILWALIAPVRMMDRALEEMEFGRANGAVAVHLHGEIAGMVLDDEYLNPFYAKAQDLDLVMAVHVGSDIPGYTLPDPRYAFKVITEIPVGFYRLCVGDLSQRFPRLRWAWLEAGASWVPFVLHEAARVVADGVTRSKGAIIVNKRLTEEHQLFVACQIDDDIPYITQYVGEDNLVMGTDYGHIDIGSDIDAAGIIARRSDLGSTLARKIVDQNGRRLYGIDPSFTPSAASRSEHSLK